MKIEVTAIDGSKSERIIPTIGISVISHNFENLTVDSTDAEWGKNYRLANNEIGTDKDMTFSFNFINYYDGYVMEKQDDKYILYKIFISKEDNICNYGAIEIAHFCKDKILLEENPYKDFNRITAWRNFGSLNLTEVIREFYGEKLTHRFNQMYNIIVNRNVTDVVFNVKFAVEGGIENKSISDISVENLDTFKKEYSMHTKRYGKNRLFKAAYIQRVEDNIFIRVFHKSNEVAPMEEISRVIISGNDVKFYTTGIGGFAEIPKEEIFLEDFEKTVCIGCEDVSGTKLEFFEKKKLIHSGDDMFSIFLFLLSDGIENFLSIFNMGEDTENTQRIFKSKYLTILNMEKGIHILFSLLSKNRNATIADTFSEIFGQCDLSANSFAKMVNIPKWSVESLKDDVSVFVIKDLKKIMGIDKFLHIDRESFFNVLKFYQAALLKFNNYEYFRDVIRCACEMFGSQNYFKIIQYVSAAPRMFHLNEYMDYMRTVSLLGTNDYPWNPSIERISEINHNLSEIYRIKMDEETNRRLLSKFERQQEKWSFYDYCDEENNLSIIHPTKPMDIIMEGTTLSHCVASYVESVADGNTLILFIRNNTELDKPYYTLEIKNNMIRQCHGFANSNITDEICNFLKKYSEEKGIHFDGDEANRMLAVN